MQAKQAWGYIVESVKNDLGEEVSQILDSVVFLSLQGSLFTLAVPDQKTKDAFEEKCRREIVRRLQGYFGATLDVSIIIDPSITTEAFPKTNEPLIEIETVEDEQTLYEILVNPKRVVVIPDYFRYWIAHLGPDLAWVYVAFRQIAYLASGGKTQGDKTIRASASRLAQLCGVSDRALFKRFAKPETWKMLHGLVEKIGDNTERYSGSAGRYKVNLSLPLIPAHTAAVKQALELLASTPFDEFVDLVKQISLEDLEDRFSSENSAPPQSVRQIVEQVCTQFNRRDKEVVISVLQESLMPSSRVLIFSHFLMEQVMPAMGPGQTWLYILLRNRSWAISGEGEVTIPGGYTELAKWLGLSRPMTVYEWVNAKPGLLWAYVTPRSKEESKTSHGTGEWLSSARTFRVLHTDIPLELLRVPVDQLCAGEISSFGVLDGKDSSDDLRKVQRLLTQSSEVTYAKFIGYLRKVQTLSL
ncbi:hypothetical protein [Anaerolinea sp.]|uniref:hypothetical protein n=1 Tax=Anaerolinea sp. TaxID=1872519 RepID=UPI002ACD7AB6|nr:hypothetical protein [Anaerolinea sp.]